MSYYDTPLCGHGNAKATTERVKPWFCLYYAVVERFFSKYSDENGW